MYLVLCGVKNNNPDANGDSPNFIDKEISCDTLRCNYYEADHHTVHQELVSFTTGQPSKDWTKATLRYMDGKRFMKVLWNQFGGEVNTARNIDKSERLCD